jgi:3-oxoacyl-[acyl-carrier protein] reductase
MSSAAGLAVVTGGSTGIGLAIVQTLASEGWDVAISYIAHDESARDAVAKLSAVGRFAWAARCDVGIKADVEQFFDALLQESGRAPDLLVNNAGVQTWSSLLELDDKSWDQVLRTNVKGCFLNTQKAARQMIAGGKRGAIVNIGSGCSKVPFPNLVDYSASKAAIDQFTRSAAIELGPHGITVNCVAPGAIENERTRAESPNYAATWAAVTPMRRVGNAADVANAVLFFADPKSNFITGQTLYVDGGVFTQPNWPY